MICSSLILVLLQQALFCLPTQKAHNFLSYNQPGSGVIFFLTFSKKLSYNMSSLRMLLIVIVNIIDINYI